jgi:GxxExxY protein
MTSWKQTKNPQITQITQMKRNSIKDPRTHEIIGAALEVHKELGHGFLEAVYQEALQIEFSSRQIPFQKEVGLPIYYKGTVISQSYRADFICYKGIVVELKAVNQLSGKEESQIINYLKSTGLEVGLLLNFGSRSLEYKRFIFERKESVKSVKSADIF